MCCGSQHVLRLSDTVPALPTQWEEGWDSHKEPVSVLGLGRRCALGDVRVRVFSRSVVSDSLTVAHQAPLSTGFPMPEYRSGLPFSTPRDLPNPGIKSSSLASPAPASQLFTLSHLGSSLGDAREQQREPHASLAGLRAGWGLQKVTQVYASSLS